MPLVVVSALTRKSEDLFLNKLIKSYHSLSANDLFESCCPFCWTVFIHQWKIIIREKFVTIFFKAIYLKMSLESSSFLSSQHPSFSSCIIFTSRSHSFWVLKKMFAVLESSFFATSVDEEPEVLDLEANTTWSLIFSRSKDPLHDHNEETETTRNLCDFSQKWFSHSLLETFLAKNLSSPSDEKNSNESWGRQREWVTEGSHTRHP